MTVDLVTKIATDGGFTYDPAADALITVGSTTGYAIAIPGTEHVVGHAGISREAFAAAVADVLTEHAVEIDHGAVLGGWYSAERDEYIVELTKIHKCSREHAIALGTATNQEAIFDLATGEEIPTGGTGDSVPTEALQDWEMDLLAPVTAWDAADDDELFAAWCAQFGDIEPLF